MEKESIRTALGQPTHVYWAEEAVGDWRSCDHRYHHKEKETSSNLVISLQEQPLETRLLIA